MATMTKRPGGAHVVTFKRPIVNPLDGGYQKNIVIGHEDYESLQKRAAAEGMGVASYVTYLLSQGLSPFRQKAADCAYRMAAFDSLKEKGAHYAKC